MGVGVLSTLDAKLVTLDDKLLGLLERDDAELLRLQPLGSQFTVLFVGSRDLVLVWVEMRPGALTGLTPAEEVVGTDAGIFIGVLFVAVVSEDVAFCC